MRVPVVSEVDRLKRDIIQLQSKNRDLSNQVEELRAGHPMSDQEWAMFRNQTATIAEQRAQLDELALWLRENRKEEIARGEHRGMGLVDVVVRYLAKGKAAEMRGKQ